MAKRRSPFRLRFRKSLTLIPGLLKLTLNKRSWSLNLTIGPYSRSWGSLRTTSGIDLPGQQGLSLGKEHATRNDTFTYATLWGVATILVVALHALIDLTRLYPVAYFQDCDRSGHPLIWTGILIVAELAGVWKWRRRWQATLLMLTAGTVANWLVWSWLIGGSLTCGT